MLYLTKGYVPYRFDGVYSLPLFLVAVLFRKGNTFIRLQDFENVFVN